MFSETTHQMLCEDCIQLASKSLSLKRIEQAFNYYQDYVHTRIRTHLLPKRLSIQEKLQKNRSSLKLLQSNSCSIANDLNLEFMAMENRLGQSFAQQAQVLENELNLVRENIHKIDMIIQTAENSSANVLEFLKGYRHLEQSASSAINTHIVENSYDCLKNELDSVREISKKYQAMKELNNFKDKIIWALLKRPRENPQEKTVKDMSDELVKFDMKCQYCNTKLDPESVNSKCEKSSNHLFKRNLNTKNMYRTLKKLLQHDLSELNGLADPTDSYKIMKKAGISSREINDVVSKYLNNGKVDFSLLNMNLNTLVAIEQIKSADFLTKFKQRDYKKAGLVSKQVFAEIMRGVPGLRDFMWLIEENENVYYLHIFS